MLRTTIFAISSILSFASMIYLSGLARMIGLALRLGSATLMPDALLPYEFPFITILAGFQLGLCLWFAFKALKQL
jgi:hypothetical protein